MMRFLLLMGMGALLPAVPMSADEPETRDEPAGESGLTADDLELRVIGNSVTFQAERRLTKGLAETGSLKRKIRKATLPLRALQRDISALESRAAAGQQQLIQLNAQLANVTNAVANNRLVGAISAIEGQLTLARQTLEQLRKRETAARADLQAAESEYVEQIVAMRELADQLDAAYASHEDDEQILAQVAELAEARGKELEFGPSNTWRSNARRLAELEESVTRERIPLRNDNGTFLASVVVNGEHTVEMVVDSGASLISLPYAMARDMGLEPGPSDQRILVTIADGSTITAWLKTASTVRVGTFEVEDVDCAVLGPEATNAAPLLGMSFLGEFQFDLDAAESTLGLIRVDDGTRRR